MTAIAQDRLFYSLHSARSALSCTAIASLSVLALVACGDDAPEESPTVVEVQVVDAQGLPQSGIYVSAYSSEDAQFFYSSDITGVTDQRGIARLEFGAGASGERWFDATDATRTPVLSSLSSGARVTSRDIGTTNFLQVTVRPFQSGKPNLPGEWRWIGADEGPQALSISQDLAYVFRWSDGEAETGTCVFKEAGWLQGHLTCSPSDGFLEREYFVMALTQRYLGLEFTGSLTLYEKQGVPDPVGPSQPNPGTGGSPPFPGGSAGSGGSSAGSGTSFGGSSIGLGPGAPEDVPVLQCDVPNAGYGRSCASDQDCGCGATVCLPVLHYCTSLGCFGSSPCPSGFTCTALGDEASGAPSACLRTPTAN